MKTENLSTLKIYKLTKEQYESRVASGDIDEHAIYLTPDEKIDLSPYATKEKLNTKADSSHTHDDRYYTESEIDEKLDTKANVSHNHDTVYDAKGSANTALASAKEYADNAATTAANTVKNDLLNGAGTAYDTLKELGDLIDTNTNAIEALETVAAGKANASHTHDDRYYTESEIDSKVTALENTIGSKASSSHTHDDRYYTETEIDSKITALNTNIDNKANTSHSHDDVYYTETEVDALLNNKADLVLITTAEIDEICNATIQNAAEVSF